MLIRLENELSTVLVKNLFQLEINFKYGGSNKDELLDELYNYKVTDNLLEVFKDIKDFIINIESKIASTTKKKGYTVLKESQLLDLENSVLEKLYSGQSISRLLSKFIYTQNFKSNAYNHLFKTYKVVVADGTREEVLNEIISMFEEQAVSSLSKYDLNSDSIYSYLTTCFSIYCKGAKTNGIYDIANRRGSSDKLSEVDKLKSLVNEIDNSHTNLEPINLQQLLNRIHEANKILYTNSGYVRYSLFEYKLESKRQQIVKELYDQRTKKSDIVSPTVYKSDTDLGYKSDYLVKNIKSSDIVVSQIESALRKGFRYKDLIKLVDEICSSNYNGSISTKSKSSIFSPSNKTSNSSSRDFHTEENYKKIYTVIGGLQALDKIETYIKIKYGKSLNANDINLFRNPSNVYRYKTIEDYMEINEVSNKIENTIPIDEGFKYLSFYKNSYINNLTVDNYTYPIKSLSDTIRSEILAKFSSVSSVTNSDLRNIAVVLMKHASSRVIYYNRYLEYLGNGVVLEDEDESDFKEETAKLIGKSLFSFDIEDYKSLYRYVSKDNNITHINYGFTTVMNSTSIRNCFSLVSNNINFDNIKDEGLRYVIEDFCSLRDTFEYVFLEGEERAIKAYLSCYSMIYRLAIKLYKFSNLVINSTEISPRILAVSDKYDLIFSDKYMTYKDILDKTSIKSMFFKTGNPINDMVSWGIMLDDNQAIINRSYEIVSGRLLYNKSVYDTQGLYHTKDRAINLLVDKLYNFFNLYLKRLFENIDSKCDLIKVLKDEVKETYVEKPLPRHVMLEDQNLFKAKDYTDPVFLKNTEGYNVKYGIFYNDDNQPIILNGYYVHKKGVLIPEDNIIKSNCYVWDYAKHKIEEFSLCKPSDNLNDNGTLMVESKIIELDKKQQSIKLSLVDKNEIYAKLLNSVK